MRDIETFCLLVMVFGVSHSKFTDEINHSTETDFRQNVAVIQKTSTPYIPSSNHEFIKFVPAKRRKNHFVMCRSRISFRRKKRVMGLEINGISHLETSAKMYHYSDPHCTRYDGYEDCNEEYSVTMLDLSYHYLQMIPEFSPRVHQSLMSLNLSYNKISSFDASVFNNFTNLKYLDLSNNYILDINLDRQSLPSRLKYGTNILDLSNQYTSELKINCTGSELMPASMYHPSFIIQAMSKTTQVNIKCPVNVQRYLNIYICTNDAPCQCNITDTYIPMCHIPPTIGNENQITWEKFVLCAVCFTGGFLICGIIGWYVFYHKAQRMQCVTYCTKYLGNDTNDKYDEMYGECVVYLVSAIEDNEMLQHFAIKLEQRCIQTIFEQRDFAHRAGQSNLSLIHGTIDNTMKTLFLLSENFIQDKECLYILHQAKGVEFSQNRYVIIIITLKDNIEKSVTMNKLLQQTLTHNVVLNYPANIDEEKLFWDKLVECIRNDVHVHIVKCN
ncbi:hypothetical protein ACF0H5_014499 [Mactra antiquata]